jgi:aldehyde:ferredoxin oxidoreductase
VALADAKKFKETIKNWVGIIKKDVGCGLFHTFGTPLAVSNLSMQGSMPARGYTAGRHEDFRKVSGDAIKNRVWERGGKMHGCMPGCVVQCSIIYNGPDGKRLCSALEYEAIGLLGTNLDIVDLDAIARLKHLCDDIGLDLIETGSALSVAVAGGKMHMGDAAGAIQLLEEVVEGTPFGAVLGNGVVVTAKALNVTRVPAFKGQGIPAHDAGLPRASASPTQRAPWGLTTTRASPIRCRGKRRGKSKILWPSRSGLLPAIPSGTVSIPCPEARFPSMNSLPTCSMRGTGSS